MVFNFGRYKRYYKMNSNAKNLSFRVYFRDAFRDDKTIKLYS